MARQTENNWKTARIPLVGNIYHRIDGTASYITDTVDQRFVNLLFRKEIQPGNNKPKFSVVKRPGMGSATTVDAA